MEIPCLSNNELPDGQAVHVNEQYQVISEARVIRVWREIIICSEYFNDKHVGYHVHAGKSNYHLPSGYHINSMYMSVMKSRTGIG